MILAYSISRFIDPRRLQKLAKVESASINCLPCLVESKCRTAELSSARGEPKEEKKYQKAVAASKVRSSSIRGFYLPTLGIVARKSNL